MEFLFLFDLFFQSINTEYKDLNLSQDLKPHPPLSSTKQQPLMKEREVDSGSVDPLRPSPPKKWERRPSTPPGLSHRHVPSSLVLQVSTLPTYLPISYTCSTD